MSSIFKLFLLCWILVFTERMLFWLWLWQLKNYHFKRFLAHFSTKKGRQLLFNLVNYALAFFLLVCLAIAFLPKSSASLPVFVILVLAADLFLIFLSVKALFCFVTLKLKRPVLTKKTGLLIAFGLFFELGLLLIFSSFGENGIPVFLLFLFLAPIVFSGLVLALQPLTVFQRNRIMNQAKKRREQLKGLKVIAITGSYGKTSTKEYLFALLSQKFKTIATKEHINAEIGIAKTILTELKNDTEIFIVEIGAYEKGKIKQVCSMLQPNIGILTGINEQHLATFGSQENIIQAKFELLDSLMDRGLTPKLFQRAAVFNGDSERVVEELEKRKEQIAKGEVKVILCSSVSSQALNQKNWEDGVDYVAADIKVEKDRLSFQVFVKSGASAIFEIQAIGKPNVKNILLAAACAQELGFGLEEVALILKKTKLKQEAVQLKQGKSGIDILDATYSANPDGVLADLEHLRLWPGKKVIVMPCLIELGSAAKKAHQLIGQKIGRVCDLAIITTQERFIDLAKGAVEAGMKEKNIFCLENPKKIIKELQPFLAQNNVILLESRVPKEVIKWLSE